MSWKVSVSVVKGIRYYNNGANSTIGLILPSNEPLLDDLQPPFSVSLSSSLAMEFSNHYFQKEVYWNPLASKDFPSPGLVYSLGFLVDDSLPSFSRSSFGDHSNHYLVLFFVDILLSLKCWPFITLLKKYMAG